MRRRSGDPSPAGMAVYRLLLRLCPPGFRARYGREMEDAFRDRCREAAGRGECRATLWAAGLWDVVRTGALERLAELRRPEGREVAAVGTASGGGTSAATAALACLCCEIPASVALLGVSGVALAEALLPLRPLLLAVAAGLVGLAFLLAYLGSAGRSGRGFAWVGAALWLFGFTAPWWTSLLHPGLH